MKTIFITLSLKNVYRNLFFFPDSVFDRWLKILNKDNNLRTVIVLPTKDLDKYIEFFKPYIGPRFIVETVSVDTSQSRLQKLFYFFYSYLIYTGTTRQLATLGMRVDEPPAGGAFKPFLAPIKFLIANTFGRIHFVKNWLEIRWGQTAFQNVNDKLLAPTLPLPLTRG